MHLCVNATDRTSYILTDNYIWWCFWHGLLAFLKCQFNIKLLSVTSSILNWECSAEKWQPKRICDVNWWLGSNILRQSIAAKNSIFCKNTRAGQGWQSWLFSGQWSVVIKEVLWSVLIHSRLLKGRIMPNLNWNTYSHQVSTCPGCLQTIK